MKGAPDDQPNVPANASRIATSASRMRTRLLREVSPLVEPLSLDEAFVDLEPSGWPDDELVERVEWLRAELTERTEGLTASVGVGSAKFLAKLASEAGKPDGIRILDPAEVARAVLWLASDDSGMMTGAVIPFDQSIHGGYDDAPAPARKLEA